MLTAEERREPGDLVNALPVQRGQQQDESQRSGPCGKRHKQIMDGQCDVGEPRMHPRYALADLGPIVGGHGAKERRFREERP